MLLVDFMLPTTSCSNLSLIVEGQDAPGHATF